MPTGKSSAELQPGTVSKGKPVSSEITGITALFLPGFGVQQPSETGQKRDKDRQVYQL